MSEPIRSIESLVKDAEKAFRDSFKEEPTVAVCAPGRVNLMGEHTDYNDGFVLPMALPLLTVVVGKKIGGEEAVVITTNPQADAPRTTTIKIPRDGPVKRGPPKWSNYVRGVIANYIGEPPPAFKAIIVSSVPAGGGLGGSAALEVAMYTFLDALTDTNGVELTNKALACQKAEHDYVNIPCGIMDQFTSFMGQRNQALLIDCRNRSPTSIPFNDPKIAVLITNSNVRHELTGNEYSSRRTQCQQAASILKKPTLREATVQDIDYLTSVNAEQNIIKRARHAITEIQRTIEASQALQVGDFKKFGQLMVQSHESLRDDFEVSTPELDQLVDLAMEVEGVLGSRMTGWGFGGCTVTLVQKSALEIAIDYINQHYRGWPTFYICPPSDGARIIKK